MRKFTLLSLTVISLLSCHKEDHEGYLVFCYNYSCDNIKATLSYNQNDLYLRLYSEGEVIDSDTFIEDQVREYEYTKLETKSASTKSLELSSVFVVCNYHTIAIESLEIIASHAILGREKGTDVSDIFKLNSSQTYIFKSDKTLLGTLSKITAYRDPMTLPEFLSYKPLLLYSMSLKSILSIPEIPEDFELTIKISLSDGRNFTINAPLNT